MLTDSVSQFETNDANHIPRSLQKLINDIHKAQGKKPKNPPLNITAKKPKFNVAIKRKAKTAKNPNMVNEKADYEGDDYSSKNSVQILDQRTITDFFHSVKNRMNSSNFSRLNETSDNADQIEIYDDTSFENNNNDRMENEVILSNEQNNFVSEFQNSECTNNNLNSREYANNDNGHNIVSFLEENERFNNNIQIPVDTTKNWKTFNDIVDSEGNVDFPNKRQKKLVSNVFYKNKNAYPKLSNPSDAKIEFHRPGNLQDTSTNKNAYVSKNLPSKDCDCIKIMKEDTDQIKNLLQQIKSVNNVISKARQEIAKFCNNGK